MQICLEEKVTFAQTSDLHWIKDLADAHRRELGFVNRAALAVAINTQEILCLPHGFLHFHHRRDQISTPYHLCVAHDQRQRGIGRQLIEAWEDKSRKNGITTLRLKCPIDLEANGFYSCVGFQRIEIESGKHRALVVWEKKLLALLPEKTKFIASLSAGGTEIEGLKKLWLLNQEFCPYQPFQQILYSPLASPSSTTEYLKEEKEAARVSEVWIDCGAYQVQQGKLNYDDLLAFLKKFYRNNQWADRYVLPDLVPLSTDSDEVVEYKVRETIHHCCSKNWQQ
ncbi:MAG: GNAT family N-acetyltransferase [Symploca sp. SIO2E6]|nr:GNAT family N-acetyltransferase [Symploca sp. SIO2E6]